MSLTYNEFIQNILDTRGRFGVPDGEYKERHHILPKCMGGNNDKENLIDLYPQEHYEAHRLLALENPHDSLLNYVWGMMTNRITKQFTNSDEVVSKEDYDETRRALAKYLSEVHKGQSFTEEHKRKISEALKGREFSEEHKNNISRNHYKGPNAMKGKHHTQESIEHMKVGAQNRSEQWRQRQSEAQTGKKKHTEEWKRWLSENICGENHPNYGRKFPAKDNPRSHKIICEGKLFYGYRECAEYYGLSSFGNICSFLKGLKPMPQKWKDRGLHFATEDELNAFE